MSHSGHGSWYPFLPFPDSLPGQTETFPYIFVGEAAFPLRTNMMCPYPGHYLEKDCQMFYYCLSLARCIIENTSGILAAKFRVFRRPIIASANKVTKITMAACVLHNYLKITDMRNPTSSSRLYYPPGYVDHEDPLSHLIQSDWRSEVGPSTGLNNLSHGK